MAKAVEISEQAFRRWPAQYGGMKADDVKRRADGRTHRIDARLDHASGLVRSAGSTGSDRRRSAKAVA